MKIFYSTLFLLSFITASAQTSSHTNIQNEVGIRNTQLIFLAHITEEYDNLVTAKKLFKPYLAFINPDVISEGEKDYFMDSFVFSDVSFQKKSRGWDGIYNMEELNYYLNNFFIRTKTPLVRSWATNTVGKIEKKPYAVLSIKNDQIQINNTYSVSFQVKPQSTTQNTLKLLYGVQYYDANNNVINDNSLCNSGLGWSTVYKMCFKLVPINQMSNWNDVNFNFTVPNNPQISYIKIRIANFNGIPASNNLNDLKDIYIDNFNMLDNSNNNMISSEDTNFNIDNITTNWEYERRYPGTSTYLFEDRTPLFDELWAAKEEINFKENAINTTKIFFVLPAINTSWDDINGWQTYYNTQEKINEIKNIITDYIDNIDTLFTNWKKKYRKPPTIEIGGLYFIDEDLRNIAKIDLINPILEHVKTELNNKGWKLTGSPFFPKKTSGSSYYCETNSSYHDDVINNLFDVCWQQPGAFFLTNTVIKIIDTTGMLKDTTVTLNADRDLLKDTHLNLLKIKKMGVNMESRLLNYKFNYENYPDEIYNRVQDYFDYGYKFGYINYPKLHYDTRGGQYISSQSNNPIEKIDYKNLYQFSRNARKGVVVNNRFEHQIDNNGLYNWVGDYQIKENTFSTTSNRDIEFTTTNSNPKISSIDIPVIGDEKVYISFNLKENFNDNQSWSAMIGVNFYDNNGNEITNVDISGNNSNLYGYHPVHNAYFLGFDTTTNYQYKNIYFTPPSNAVKVIFFLLKYRVANINWKNLKIHKESINNNPDIFYMNAGNPLLIKEEKIKNGLKNLKLDYANYVVSEENISIEKNRPYVLSLSTKEILPLKNVNKTDKALIGIQAFDKNGVLIPGAIGGLDCCSPINNMSWTYITNVQQDWTTFTTNPITFNSGVASIKIYLYNWFYDNTILMDNLSFEYYEDDYSPTIFPLNNKLFKEKWNEAFPATTEQLEPTYYNDLIDVEGVSSMTFSAMFKAREEINLGTANRLLMIEYLDENYNVLTNDDLTSNETGLSYSSFYKYWYADYFHEIDTYNCDNVNSDGIWWINQWEKLERSFSIPNSVKWIRLSIQHLSFEGQTRMLNPILIGSSISGAKNNETTETVLFLEENKINNKLLTIYPNPTSKTINIDFLEFKKEDTSQYFIYDLTGKLIKEGSLGSQKNSIDVLNLASGLYFVNISINGNLIVRKFIKD